MGIDVLVLAAHPDDAEMIVGGTIAKLVDRGKSVVIMDMTRGEMGTRGTPETRASEADAASKVLGVADRINLDLGDGTLTNDLASRVRVIEEIRRLKPTIVLTHYWQDLHPDHCATGEIVKSIMYPMGIEKFPADGEPYRPNEVLFFMAHFPFEPSFVVDTSEYIERKFEAIRCYGSQLHREDTDTGERSTLISSPDFLKYIEARGRYFGSMIYRSFGEPLLSLRPVPVDDPVDLYRPFPKV